ncbi:helix-turn-helix domain-containing protein [Sandaracinobacteroides saxicola]|uniref:Helix-turn-helix transcriptional regulator n=1 Tax=Sandaracinobacteroides saxicola TaxID=2759707 RepID=A0A7G5IKB2_9SPHN|nr:helix-turn-helix transcriptional regulator [Sandaracinobacteroides saxicola]QMW23804.1 helix-turn-helix transcriptional regulator [Sandaracinobacteroides saxicola]
MDVDDGFGAKLALAIKALSVSRSRLAHELAVDKSAVGRWVSGTALPSAHNLERLTQRVAATHPGFTMADWDVALPALAARLGVTPPQAAAPDVDWLAPGLMTEARANTAMRGGAYEGVWRTTRPSADNAGAPFVHDHMVQRVAPDGLLRYRLGVFGLRFHGIGLPIQGQLFSIASDTVSGVFIFSIVKAVARRKAVVLDGLTLTCLRNTDGDIVATPCIFERVADLPPDPADDDAVLERCMRASSFAAAEAVDPAYARRLLPDIGPAAHAAGGELLLLMRFAESLSRAAPIGGRD